MRLQKPLFTLRVTGAISVPTSVPSPGGRGRPGQEGARA
jgi:hypothetical protein